MTLPRLSMEEVGAIAIERSADGSRWTAQETFVWDEERGYFTAGMDSFSAIEFGGKNTYITYVEQTDYRDFYLRLTLESSRYAGTSNAVKVTVPAGAEPGEDVKPPTTGDYEDSGGNRGGSQGEFDREGQKEPAKTPAPVESPTPPREENPPQEEPSQQTIPQQTETDSTPTGQETVLSGGSGGLSGGDHDSTGSVQKPLSQPLLPPESAPADPAPIPEETDAPADDGDTVGIVAAATLAVCLLGAAWLYLLHKRSLKRKS